MKLFWQIEGNDIVKFKAFYDQHKDKSFVKNRIHKNVNKNIPDFTRDEFWKAMVSCLLTTQQRSGPESRVTTFISKKPFPLSYPDCKTSGASEYVHKTITDFGGIRRGNTIGQEAEKNLKWLETTGWIRIEEMYEGLMNNDNKEVEREWVEFIIARDKNNKKIFSGFGPKQSRNLLQMLGLTKYEIPVDSRIIKWLNIFGFPLKLSSGALADSNYYNFILDGFQELCKHTDIYPCLMDAAIFSSNDKEWPKDRLIY